jgi:hypothetical protein
MNNWHRKIWTLKKSDDSNFYRSDGGSNQFWLEPAAYVGPDVTVPKSGGAIPITNATTYTQNRLCFRVQFLDGAMTDAWRDLVLFATGTDDTERIENVVSVPGPPLLEAQVRAFLTTAASPKLYLSIEYEGGGNGWIHTT